MGAGIGQIAGEQVVEEHVPLGGLERVVGLDRVAADGLRDDLLAQASAFPRLAALLLEIGDDGADELGHIAGLDHRRQSVDQKRARPKAGDADAGLLQRLDLREEEVGFARKKFERDGKEKLLRGRVLERHAFEHLLEEDAFVRGVLVDEDEALGAFRDEIKLRDAADDMKAEPVGDEWLGARRGALREGFTWERKRGLRREWLNFSFEV